MGITRVLSATLVLVILTQMSSQQASTAAVVPAQEEAASETKTPTGDVERGRYIVERVAMCAQCHSPRDEEGNIISEQRFMGAPIPFKPPWPNNWAIRAPRNRGLPGYTEELAIRLLTQGAIGRNGQRLRPPMPRFRMTRQDAADVVAYMKSLP
ncbi:MAG: c-type cytochrome [Vicinamibacteraceae bacterium]